MTESYEEWMEKSKIKLREIIKSNYTDRLEECTKIINQSMKEFYPNEIIPPFQISQSNINTALRKFYKHVNDWNGVDLHSIRKPMPTFQSYFQRANNWWNRYKSSWCVNY